MAVHHDMNTIEMSALVVAQLIFPYQLNITVLPCRIYGDFFGQGNIHDVEEHLIGTRMVKADLIERLNDIDLTFYFGNLSVEEFVSFILS